MPQPRTPAKPKPDTNGRRLGLADLTDDERAELLDELRATAAGPQPVHRELTPYERAVRLLLPDRAHFEGCPIIDDEERAAGRVEASNETRPPDHRIGRPPQPVTSVRCIECGGSKVLEGTLGDNLITTLEAAGADRDLDTTLE